MSYDKSDNCDYETDSSFDDAETHAQKKQKQPLVNARSSNCDLTDRSRDQKLNRKCNNIIEKSNKLSFIQTQIEKLVRHYDVASMAHFIIVECHGTDEMVNKAYAQTHRRRWETFLKRSEACRLDFSKKKLVSMLYDDYVNNVAKDQQSETFRIALSLSFQIKGAVDMFHVSLHHTWNDVAGTFPGHLVKLVEKKIEGWFDKFEAISVKLSGTVLVSNYLRVLSGIIDALCTRRNKTYLLVYNTTELDSPRPLELMNLCLLRMLAIQNGFESEHVTQVTELSVADDAVDGAAQNAHVKTRKNELHMGMLTLHITADRPILRLWEYIPTQPVLNAINEYNADKLMALGDNFSDFSVHFVTNQ